MKKSLNTLLAFLILCSVLVCGCACEKSTYDPRAQWITIQGRDISLRLPTYFRGGDPADPAVVSVLGKMAESTSNPDERERLVEWLDVAQSSANLHGSPILMAWAAPDDGGSVASVTVSWDSLQNLLAFSDGDSSTRALVEARMYPLVEPEWEFESLTADEARVVAHYDEGTEYASAELTLFKRYGELFYDVLYSCPEESWDEEEERWKG